MFRWFKIAVEKHADGYVAYLLDLRGVVIGEGDTYEDALADVKSAIAFHIETFGSSVLEQREWTSRLKCWDLKFCPAIWAWWKRNGSLH